MVEKIQTNILIISLELNLLGVALFINKINDRNFIEYILNDFP